MAGDLNRPDAPRFVFISPDQCNDMHGGVYTAVPGYPETPCPYNSANDDPADVALKHNADAFVRGAVTTIMSSRAWTPHSAIFIVADEGDYTGNASTGGWASPAGCCDSPVLPAGDPDISASWPGGVYGGGLVPAIVIDPAGRGTTSAPLPTTITPCCAPSKTPGTCPNWVSPATTLRSGPWRSSCAAEGRYGW